ncbi:hypothetical protein PR202_ga14241 [Eleusine coracana subsp. coracana]|uniref:OTU domain-containing protein n=1 Tax=Eleusine coracana subsp. coracana TaxID=191504 RepID=A0AAV5CH27_ELECO|nr:hypothetical protein PR202_ga14241 [Eleusine coracana subsp. coracana]
MVLCKMDPDITRWGLHHLLPGGVASDYSAPTTTTAVADFTGYAQLDDGHTSVDINIEHVTCNNAVENDEIIAQALQEELSQIAQAEAFGAFSSAADDNRSAVLAQEWSHPRIIHVAASGSASAPSSQQAESREPFTSCSNPGDDNVKDGEPCLIDLVEDFSVLDGEVGKRLNDMVPVPHVPKTNGEIPSVDEAISDHQRLLDRLVLYGLVELKVNGDGNCQLESHPDLYAGYVPMDYKEYLKKMSKIALRCYYGVKIFILTSFRDTCYIEILPIVEKSKRDDEGGIQSYVHSFVVSTESLIGNAREVED